jgi:diguanylate cyclase (GGDEF)-like protein/PAS domain S-box-containing protein
VPAPALEESAVLESVTPELLRQITAQIPGVVYRVHASLDGARRYIFVSDGVRSMFGVSPQDVLADGGLLFRFLHPEDRHSSAQDVRRALETDDTFSSEPRICFPDGRVKWLQIISMVERRDALGVVRNGVMIDISVQKQAQLALMANETLLRDVTAQIPGLVYRVRVGFDGSKVFDFVSSGVQALYGLSVGAVLADGSSLDRLTHPEDRLRVAGEMRAATWAGGALRLEFRIVLADGSLKWVHLTDSEVARDDHGIVCSGVMIDITDRKEAEAALHERDAMWKLALDSSGDGAWDWNVQTGIGVCSPRMLEMYGYIEAEMFGATESLDDRTHPDDKAQMRRDRQAHLDGLTPIYVNEHRIQCRDGSWKWVLSRGTVISRDAQGRALRMTGTHTDITQRKRDEALIWEQAHRDALTGLPNRRLLREQLTRDLAQAQADGLHVAVLFIDLDHFKEVNDTLGHDQGDALLIQVAERIASHVGAGDTVARMGGDEFTVLLPRLVQPVQADAMAARLIEALARPFQLGDECVVVSASIGIALSPQDAMAMDGLFKQADQALYVAKGAGRNRFSRFTPELQRSAAVQARRASDMRAAWMDGQFWVAYQPVVTLGTGHIAQVEALLRWQHPDLGVLAPEAFMATAQSSGLMVELGNWVMREAAQQIKGWRERYNPELQINLNRSAVEFRSEGRQCSGWTACLAALDLPGNTLVVDISETLLLDAGPALNAQLRHLRAAGISLCLDDFGTGPLSLAQLQQHPLDRIKMDRRFVAGVAASERDRALCRAIIALAHGLGMTVVAEGVETADQLRWLREAGCDCAQGFGIAPPMTAVAFEAYLRENRGFVAREREPERGPD